jgi:hypothetical protein
MRVVITHFFNEELLLPFWLRHHLELFDFGVLINHGSNDDSVDICNDLAPHWRIVNSSLEKFDAILTDFEVMDFERQFVGWKIALNVTEFLVPTRPLVEVETALVTAGREGCSSRGVNIVDIERKPPSDDLPLIEQYRFGFDDSSILDRSERLRVGLPPEPNRNRFYHKCDIGAYHPGRHRSWHPDSLLRVSELQVYHFGFAPWTNGFIDRKLQIASKLKKSDVEKGMGIQHTKTRRELELNFNSLSGLASRLPESSK